MAIVTFVGGFVVAASLLLAPFVMFAHGSSCTNYYRCTDSGCGECAPVWVAGIAYPFVQAGAAGAAMAVLTKRLPRFIPAAVLLAWVVAAYAIGYWYYVLFVGGWP